eukprot:UN06549
MFKLQTLFVAPLEEVKKIFCFVSFFLFSGLCLRSFGFLRFLPHSEALLTKICMRKRTRGTKARQSYS